MHKSRTAKLYQSGIELDQAIVKGADPEVFKQLEAEFNGGSIPVHLLHGFKYRPPYSCEYHSGGTTGARLRDIIKNYNETR